MNLITKTRDSAVRILGRIKIFKYPMFILYKPYYGHTIQGPEIEKIKSIIRPGDICLRGFSNYLDGMLIPGNFSHASFYLGELKKSDAKHCSKIACNEIFISELIKKTTPFQEGEHMLIHSMGEGIFTEDLATFCRCDKLIILRMPEKIICKNIKLKQDKDPSRGINLFNDEEKKIYEDIKNEKEVSYQEIFPTLSKVALGKLGAAYDFGFDFRSFDKLSCTEFVFFIIKSLQNFHKIYPRKKNLYILHKLILAPDDFIRKPLKLIYHNETLDKKVIDDIKKRLD